jgi:hypothetical protein
MIDWLRGLFGSSQRDEVGQAAEDEEIEIVVNAYGALIERFPLAILPSSMLPKPKARMKELLKEAWLGQDDPYMKEAVESGYVNLCQYRDDVEQVLDSTPPSKPDLEWAQNVLKPYTAFSEKMLAEQAELAREFEDFKKSAGCRKRSARSADSSS